jgi:putative NADH-flavin reductase
MEEAKTKIKDLRRKTVHRNGSAPDFAVAIVDELEKPQHIRARFTVGY